MKRLRFVMIGGFLGAGKTTTVGRLAAMYRDRGQRVGIVTNDQASDLVDTSSLASLGFPVAEVPGACFCCKFDALVDAVDSLSANERPDVILAEPVGSCTDLVATVVQALRRHVDAIDVAPFAVVLKPSLARLALLGESDENSSRIGYIFRKQLEEADAIVVNRADELTPMQLASLTELVAERYPQTPILAGSARTGLGFDGLFEILGQAGDFGRRVLDIDYDRYADAEAALGWLNTSVRLRAPRPVAIDTLLCHVVAGIDRALQQRGAEAAHVKALALADGRCAVANLIGTGLGCELSRPSDHAAHEIELVVNARVLAEPDTLITVVHGVLGAVAARYHATLSPGKTSAFRPSRPVPTHRYDVAL